MNAILTKSIIFSLDGIIFGIPINQVGRLGKPGKIDPITGAPDWISGLLNYRDKLLPYIKFWKILKISPPSKEFLLLPYDFGYCAFGISEIKGIFKMEIRKKNVNILRIPYIMGFGELQGEVVIFVDLKNFLSKEQVRIVRKLYKKNEK